MTENRESPPSSRETPPGSREAPADPTANLGALDPLTGRSNGPEVTAGAPAALTIRSNEAREVYGYETSGTGPYGYEAAERDKPQPPRPAGRRYPRPRLVTGAS
jgi:hypothetical protein